MAQETSDSTVQDAKRPKLVGYENFVRSNPNSDKFEMDDFHHLEFYAGDATNVSLRFGWALGLGMVAKSDNSTGNTSYCSYVMRSGKVTFAFTAPYTEEHNTTAADDLPYPSFSHDTYHTFFRKHGLAVRAMGVKVTDAANAYETATANGAVGVTAPFTKTCAKTGQTMTISEIQYYGDVVMRYMSGNFEGSFLPGYEETTGPDVSIGLTRIDHVVGNVWKLLDTVGYITQATGMHEFAEFVAEDVGTVDSGLNSMVLANNSELVLTPINEPTYGTPRKSQIQTYLEQNLGPGVQHIALKTDDIFHTLTQMRDRKYIGGFDFMPRPQEGYYRRLPARIGDAITEEQYRRAEELGILVDRDDQGVLLQIFTKPLGDRPTVFVEIIQRIGCMEPVAGTERVEQAAGCGGFGKGNFAELFKSIEDYERSLAIDGSSQAAAPEASGEAAAMQE